MSAAREDEGVLVSEPVDGVLLLTFGRPRAKNALNNGIYLRCARELDRVAEDSHFRAVVLTGTHGVGFTSGQDLREAQHADFGVAMDQPWYLRPVGRFMRALLRCRKLVVAAVDGIAVGIGTTMLLYCDVVFCTQDSSFWVPFARVGLVPEFGSSIMLGRVLGPILSRDMLLTGKKLSSVEAHQAGLVTRIWNGPDARSFISSVLQEVSQVIDCTLREAIPEAKRLLRTERQITEIEHVIEQEFVTIDRLRLQGHTQAAIAFAFRSRL